ncbi:MAG TPA: hypothetical protein VFF59_01155 [Anaerolineae bacterium]|nr:hypothetical protein [Anaerolineae bacterium]
MLTHLRHKPVILASTLFVPLALAYWPFKIDDAYISFVYAKNLVQGHGLTYNGLVVEGYSNFLWTVMIAPFIALGWDPLVVARFISLGCAVATLFLTERLIRRLNPTVSALASGLALLTIAVSVPFTAWTLGGLETALMTLEVALFVYCELHADPRLTRWSVIVALACALTRPEGAMLFPILIAHRLIYRSQPVRQIVRQGALFVVPFAAYLLWRYVTYGYWLPNTAFLKLDSSLATLSAAANWLLAYLQLRPLLAGLLVMGLAGLVRDRLWADRNWCLVLGVIGAFIAFVLYAGPDWMPHHRFIVPIIPLLGLLTGRALSLFRHVWLQRATYILALGGVVLEVVFALTTAIPIAPRFGDYTDGLIRGGVWIQQNTTPQDTIAVVDAGALAYYSERRTIDIIGLNDAHIAHAPGKSDAAYVLAQCPKVVQLHIEFSPSTGVWPPTQRDHNWDIFYHPAFQSDYAPYWAGTADPFFPFLFTRQPD